MITEDLESACSIWQHWKQHQMDPLPRLALSLSRHGRVTDVGIWAAEQQ